MEKPLRFAVVAAIALVIAAIDYFLLLPRDQFGFISGWALGIVVFVTAGLGSVLLVLAAALAARDALKRRSRAGRS